MTTHQHGAALPLVAVGGSAGSLGPLIDLAAALPADLPAAVVVTTHIGESRSRLAPILHRSGSLPAMQALDGQELEPGQIYVAPPGHHLLVAQGRIKLSAGPRVNRHRPAIDVMFASVAAAAGPRAVGVVLSGVLDDGAVGSALIASRGGPVLVQAVKEAEFPPMPAAALAAAPGAVETSTAELGSRISELIARGWQSTATAGPVTEDAQMNMADSDDPAFLSEGESRLTRLACPECGGALAEVDLPQITYFRCHVGHQYGPQTLADAQAEAVEAKLWSAVAALEEQAAFHRYLIAARAGSSNEPDPDERTRRIAERAQSLREQVRRWSADLQAPVQ